MPTFSRSAMRGLFALPVALLIAAGPVLAEPQDESVITATHGSGTITRGMKVSYRDLDLTTPRDQGRLARRVEAAADAVCANERDQLWDKFETIDQRRCHSDAVATALASIPGAATSAARD